MELEERVIEAIKDSGFGHMRITSEMSLMDDIDMDSLDIVEACMEVEDVFAIRIDDSESDKWKTVQDVIDTVKAKKVAK